MNFTWWVEVFNNNWVVCVIGGIISGIVVIPIGTWLYGRNLKNANTQAVKNANSEIIHVLKQYLANGEIPEYGIVICLVRSIARKYDIPAEQLFTRQILCEELISDVMADEYISSVNKKNITDTVKKYNEENVDCGEWKNNVTDVQDIDKYLESKREEIERAYRDKFFRRYLIVGSTFYFVFICILLFCWLMGYFEIKEVRGVEDSTEFSFVISFAAGMFSAAAVIVGNVLWTKGKKK